MRYQQYKNRMLKIRKVIDFFYRFRFVFAGVITAVVAGSITLDVTRGNITETTQFKIAYQYGEEIQCSGSAFMGNVTYEFRKKGDQEWQEEKPIYPGQYEARAKSKGSHGYKYSEESSFTITPYHTLFKVKNTSVNFGDDSPELTYDLLPGDRLDENYRVDYADKTSQTTKASVRTSSITIYNKDNLNVTSCYDILTDDVDVTFIPQKLTFTFNNPGAFTFTGDEDHPFTADEYTLSDPIHYDAYPVITGGVSRVNIGSETNHHNIAIKDAQGNDYTANYDIRIKENTVTVNKAATVTITSSSLNKTYDGEPFDENQFTYEVNGLLTNIHEVTDVVFDKKDVKDCNEANNIQNTFTYKIRDKRTGEEIDPRDFYQGTGVSVTYGTINIKRVPITINTPTIEHTFDNKEVKGYQEGDIVNYTGSLVGDDFIKVESYPTKTVPGKYSNDYVCKVYRKMMVDGVLTDVDVSSNYHIEYSTGNISIKVDPLVIKFDGRDLPYNGAPQVVYQNNNHGHITNGTLPTGWTYEATVYNNLNEYGTFTMTDVLANNQGYRANEEQVVVQIWDEYGNPVVQHYIVDNVPSHSNDDNCDITFVFEESKVTKVDLNVTVTDFDPITYNHMTLEENLDLASRVSSVGLKGDDEIRVSYSNSSQKAIKDAKTTPYNVGLNIEVYNRFTDEPTGGNYDIHYSRSEPITSSVKINRKNVTIHTPDIDMVYKDDTAIQTKDIDFSTVKVFDEYDNPLDDLEVTFNTNKTYTSPSATVGTHTYTSFEEKDLIIRDKNTHEILHQDGVLDNYNINLIEDGTIEIKPRLIEVYQVDDESKDHIFYDGQIHGVFNGSKEIDYTHEDNSQEIGLLESKSHSINFGIGRFKDTANGPGEASKYGEGIADKVAYYGITIYKGSDSVIDNYKVQFPDDYIYINVIKKKIDITSASSKKVFDGDAFDLYPEYEADEWVDIKLMKATQFTYQITRYDENTHDYVNADLDDGDVLQVKKTVPSVLEDSKNVGNHTNEFEWRVVDKNGITKPTDFYNVFENYGTLEVKKLYIDLSIDHREKEYDSFNITFPNGDFIDSPYDGYQFTVDENSRSSGVLLDYRPVPDLDSSDPNATIPFNKKVFDNNFKIVARIYRRSYPKFYLANDYLFDIQTYIYLSNLDTIYYDTSNVELSFYNATLQYRVTRPRIELKRTKVTTTLELRILVGSLRADDTLYFGEEQYTTQLGRKPRVWESEFLRSNVHIYRNNNMSDEVTDCYYIVM